MFLLLYTHSNSFQIKTLVFKSYIFLHSPIQLELNII